MQSTNQDFRDIIAYPSYKAFIENGAFFILKETLEAFFHCKVVLYSKPSLQLIREFDIDIMLNPRRGFYPIDNDNVVIVARVLSQRRMISALGIHLKANSIGENVKLLNKLEGALTGSMTQEFHNFFQYGILPFGDELIKHTITNYLCQGYYDFRLIRHLIEYFFKLRTTSFEGSFFSTGAIITKAYHDFIKGTEENRFGQTFQLTNPIRIRSSNRINKREWYLADGKKSFFLGNKKLDFTNLFVLDGDYTSANYIDNHSLSLTLKGGDILFKVESEKLLSINSSTGFEFIFFENQWRFRNYRFLKTILTNTIEARESIVDALIFYILACSKKQNSSIIWFPKNMEEIDGLIQPATKNKFIETPLSLEDKRFINHIFRCLSNDGATIIDQDGTIRYFGVIVDLSKITVSGLKGTGESAASALAANGTSIKISQDGNIKIFLSPGQEPLYF